MMPELTGQIPPRSTGFDSFMRLLAGPLQSLEQRYHLIGQRGLMMSLGGMFGRQEDVAL
jgi:hypothetical protein